MTGGTVSAPVQITDYTAPAVSADVTVQVKVVVPKPAQPLSPQSPHLLMILKLFLLRYRSLITDHGLH